MIGGTAQPVLAPPGDLGFRLIKQFKFGLIIDEESGGTARGDLGFRVEIAISYGGAPDPESGEPPGVVTIDRRLKQTVRTLIGRA